MEQTVLRNNPHGASRSQTRLFARYSSSGQLNYAEKRILAPSEVDCLRERCGSAPVKVLIALKKEGKRVAWKRESFVLIRSDRCLRRERRELVQ